MENPIELLGKPRKKVETDWESKYHDLQRKFERINTKNRELEQMIDTISKEKRVNQETILKIYDLYVTYKSRFYYSEEKSKNKRTKPKQRVIDFVNSIFNFESEEDAKK